MEIPGEERLWRMSSVNWKVVKRGDILEVASLFCGSEHRGRPRTFRIFVEWIRTLIMCGKQAANCRSLVMIHDISGL